MSLPLGTRVDTGSGKATVYKVKGDEHWVKPDFAHYVETYEADDLVVIDESLDLACVRLLNPTATSTHKRGREGDAE